MRIGSRILKAIASSTLATMIISGSQVVQIATLARHLPETDLGLMAVVLMIVGLTQAIQDMGLSNAIIQRRSISKSQLSSLYWLNIVFGIILTTGIYIVGPTIALFFKEPRLIEIIMLLSPVFLIGSLGSQYRVLYQKNLNFVLLETVNVLAALLALVLTLYFIFSDFGILALIYAIILQSLFANLSFLIFGGYKFGFPRFEYNHSDLSGFYSFGVFQMGERLVNYSASNFDKILVGKFLGMELLGSYNLAWQLVIFPLTKISPVIGKVAFPVFSKIQSDDEKTNEFYILNLKFLGILMFPVFIFMFLFPEETVTVFYGRDMTAVIEILPLFAFLGLLKAIGSPGGAVILSKGFANVGFYWNIFISLISLVSLYWALMLWPGLHTPIVTLLIVFLTIGNLWHYLVRRFGHIRYRPVLMSVAQLFFAVLGIGFIVKHLVYSMFIENLIIQLIVAFVLSFFFYSIYLYVWERKLLTLIRKF